MAAQATTKELRQKKLIDHLRKEENWMKWGILAALIVVLLLLLFIGYVTDWTAGLKSGSTPLSSTLDTSTQPASSTPPNSNNPGSTGTTNTGSTGTTTNTGSSSNQRANTGTSTTTDTNRSSTTNNTTNTTNTTTTTTPPPTVPATPPAGLLSLYADSSVGEPLVNLLRRATSAGISASCTDGLLVTDCTFAVGEYKITTKSLLGTGLLTSVLKNF